MNPSAADMTCVLYSGEIYRTHPLAALATEAAPSRLLRNLTDGYALRLVAKECLADLQGHLQKTPFLQYHCLSPMWHFFIFPPGITEAKISLMKVWTVWGLDVSSQHKNVEWIGTGTWPPHGHLRLPASETRATKGPPKAAAVPAAAQRTPRILGPKQSTEMGLS